MLRTLDMFMQKEETRSLFLTTYKPQLRLDKDLGVRTETLKLLGKELSKCFRTKVWVKVFDFFFKQSQSTVSKSKIWQNDYNEFKCLCTAKKTASRVTTLYGMAANICKLFTWQEIDFHNIQGSQTAQQENNN